MVWSLLSQLQKMETSHNKIQKKGVTWLQVLAQFDCMAPSLESVVNECGDKTSLGSLQINRVLRDTRDMTERAELERSKIKCLMKPFLKSSAGRMLSIGRRLKRRLEIAIDDLDEHVRTQSKLVTLVRQNRDIRRDIGEAQYVILLQRKHQELAPMETTFLLDDIIQVLFVAKLAGIQYYAPGKTIRILADSSTGLVHQVFLIDTEETSGSLAADSGRSAHQNECRSLLEMEVERLQEVKVEMDISEVIQHIVAFLSRLERHYLAMVSSISCM